MRSALRGMTAHRVFCLGKVSFTEALRTNAGALSWKSPGPPAKHLNPSKEDTDDAVHFRMQPVDRSILEEISDSVSKL